MQINKLPFVLSLSKHERIIFRRAHTPIDTGHCRDRLCCRAAAGFTLVELIMTMIVVGILAVAVLPRFADVSVFEARGFRDETLSLLRYAQKSAVAQRRTVCVAVNPTADNPNKISLTIHTAPVPTVICDGGALTLPVTPRGGSGLVTTHATFNFLASGAASDNVTLTIVDDIIRVEAATGYVYVP